MQDNNDDVWWICKKDQLLSIAEDHLNAYVYDLESINAAALRILALKSVSRVLYALKANCNPDVIRTLADAGTDFDCVSPGEVMRLQEVLPDYKAARILFTPNFAPREEYEWGLAEGLQVTLDNLYPLKAWPEIFSGQKLFIRIDPDRGGGHHEHVVTVGARSKFGVSLAEVGELERLIKAAGATVIGIHAHSGSGIFAPENWHAVATALKAVAERFPNVRVLDLGGGIGVPERRGDEAFNLQALDTLLLDFKRENDRYDLWLEPGRFLVSDAGILLAHVTQTKGKADQRYVGISTGINALIRPALYGAYHEIINLTRIDEPDVHSVTFVGPICESGDKLGTGRMMPACSENDVILIANAGAYGQVMSSNYNLRDVPPEIVIQGTQS